MHAPSFMHSSRNSENSKMKSLLTRRLSRPNLTAGSPLDTKSVASFKSNTSVSGVLRRTFNREKENDEHKDLLRDYKKLLKAFDSQKERVWQSVDTCLDGKDAALRLVETSSAPYSQEIQNISHELIFRLVLRGSITFSDKWSEDEGGGNISFIKEHVEYLAIHYPTTFLMSTMVDKPTEARKFLLFINRVWKEEHLPHTIQDCDEMLKSYASKHTGIRDNIFHHAQYIISRLNFAGAVDNMDDISLFIGLFPWLYYKLEPYIKDNEWSSRSLSVDDEFLEATKDLLKEESLRIALMKNMGAYYSQADDTNTPLQVAMYLWSLDLFEVDPKSIPGGIPPNLPTKLLSMFPLGGWQVASFFVCIRGESIVRGMQSFLGPESIVTLVRFITYNLKTWDQVKKHGALEYGMIRTLFLALSVCGLPAFFKQGTKEEFVSLVWKVAALLEESDSQPDVTPSIVITTPTESAQVLISSSDLTSRDSDLERACAAVPVLSGAEDEQYRRTLKNVLCTVILRDIINSATEKEVPKLETALSDFGPSLEPFRKLIPEMPGAEGGMDTTESSSEALTTPSSATEHSMWTSDTDMEVG